MKELIQQANLTQRQLSDRSGLSEKAINDLVRGISFPRLDRAVVLARELGVSLNQFCEALGISLEGLPTDTNQNADRGDDAIGMN